MENWLNNRDSLYKRLPMLGKGTKTLVSSASGAVVLSHSHFDAFEGEGYAQPYAVLGMCMVGGGRTKKISDDLHFDGIWRPGRVGLALPSSTAKGFTPAMEMLGISFNLNDVPACHGKKSTIEDLRRVSARLFDDELVSSIMIALLRDAEVHATSSAFFDHGLSLALHRLITLTTAQAPVKKSLNKTKLTNIFEYIETHLGNDISVTNLSILSGLSAKTLTRTFRHETGYTPYKYLTIRRMERAKELLRLTISITEIATTVGYENPAKFSSAFSKLVGCTPSAWRKKY
jgi:AraC family transcriptional regulator